ncbi:proteasome ATPase [Aestuariimicrobium kwangyangense]|uniref:proteasome ATPase n=1 Tax=Aestuariimicrobium kwangyangense TaxID=396389 RepID=UPI0003B487DB|nr:proteasome ATPase [Aestuariimicrobium kwangyangense]
MVDELELAQRRLADARTDARQLAAQNETLNRTLKEARGQLVSLRSQLDALQQPPLGRARVVGRAGDLLDVLHLGRALRVATAPEVGAENFELGDLVLLNDAMIVVGSLDDPIAAELGELANVIEVRGEFAVVSAGNDEARVRLVPRLLAAAVEAGDSVLVDRSALLALSVVARRPVDELVLGEVPDISYSDIGGLSDQIERIRDAVELPFLHQSLFATYQLKAPKGVLLYGPPGCGKTMIAKAVAKSLTDQLGVATATSESCFISVKGPELLSKYVGETERQLRRVFERAREQATMGLPVIVFFDEMDSLFRTRGSGVSSDVESTIVPQLLAEIDGVQELENVIIIGASNREDMIDPAILRPGRLDVKIKLDRPSRAGADEIMAKYLVPTVPLHADDVRLAGGQPERAASELIDAAVTRIYDRGPDSEYIRVTYASGDTEVLHYADFVSGAMLRNIVDRAKKYAIKEELAGRAGGVSRGGLLQAVNDEFRENEELPNTSNPDDWARISGRKGERIVFIQPLTGDRA